MTLIVDTGGLLSVLDDKQDDHELFLDAVRSARSPLLLSPLVLTELDHLILDRYGRQAELSAIEEVEAAIRLTGSIMRTWQGHTRCSPVTPT